MVQRYNASPEMPGARRETMDPARRIGSVPEQRSVRSVKNQAIPPEIGS